MLCCHKFFSPRTSPCRSILITTWVLIRLGLRKLVVVNQLISRKSWNKVAAFESWFTVFNTCMVDVGLLLVTWRQCYFFVPCPLKKICTFVYIAAFETKQNIFWLYWIKIFNIYKVYTLAAMISCTKCFVYIYEVFCTEIFISNRTRFCITQPWLIFYM